MNLSKITSWVSSAITNPVVGAVTGTVYGLQQRLASLENIRASTILNKPLQDVLWNSVGTRLQAIQDLLSNSSTQHITATAVNTGLTFLSTPIRYLPGVIGSIVAIASAKDWIAGGAVAQGEKAQRTMAVAATIALTVLPTLIEASGLVPAWANFGELATAITQGMALYYAAKAASLYGHKTISKLLIGGSALLSAVNFTYFSQHAYGFTTAPDTGSNLLAGIATTGSILGGAKVFSWIFGKEAKTAPPQNQVPVTDTSVDSTKSTVVSDKKEKRFSDTEEDVSNENNLNFINNSNNNKKLNSKLELDKQNIFNSENIIVIKNTNPVLKREYQYLSIDQLVKEFNKIEKSNLVSSILCETWAAEIPNENAAKSALTTAIKKYELGLAILVKSDKDNSINRMVNAFAGCAYKNGGYDLPDEIDLRSLLKSVLFTYYAYRSSYAPQVTMQEDEQSFENLTYADDKVDDYDKVEKIDDGDFELFKELTFRQPDVEYDSVLALSDEDLETWDPIELETAITPPKMNNTVIIRKNVHAFTEEAEDSKNDELGEARMKRYSELLGYDCENLLAGCFLDARLNASEEISEQENVFYGNFSTQSEMREIYNDFVHRHEPFISRFYTPSEPKLVQIGHKVVKLPACQEWQWLRWLTTDDINDGKTNFIYARGKF